MLWSCVNTVTWLDEGHFYKSPLEAFHKTEGSWFIGVEPSPAPYNTPYVVRRSLTTRYVASALTTRLFLATFAETDKDVLEFLQDTNYEHKKYAGNFDFYKSDGLANQILSILCSNAVLSKGVYIDAINKVNRITDFRFRTDQMQWMKEIVENGNLHECDTVSDALQAQGTNVSSGST